MLALATAIQTSPAVALKIVELFLKDARFPAHRPVSSPPSPPRHVITGEVDDEYYVDPDEAEPSTKLSATIAGRVSASGGASGDQDPELVAAAASATLLAVENGALEGELRASRARILEAGNAERQRIERDLHDSAQQRLVALRVHLALAGDQLDRPEEREVLDRLGLEVDEAIEELRDVAHGVYPQLLAQHGLVAALDAIARRSAIPVRVFDDGLTRHSEALEMTVYFCCLECVQNAAKHAGTGASVTIRVGEPGRLRHAPGPLAWATCRTHSRTKHLESTSAERGSPPRPCTVQCSGRPGHRTLLQAVTDDVGDRPAGSPRRLAQFRFSGGDAMSFSLANPLAP